MSSLGDTPLEALVLSSDDIRAFQAADPANSPHSVNLADNGVPSFGKSRSGVHVVGAGMAGLLAAAMLRKQCAGIFDWNDQLPNNHSAVLRFRSSVVADTFGIPFKEVTAIKATERWRNPIADAMAYSIKTNGSATLRSVLTADGTASRRFIAPPDLIARMANAVEAEFELGAAYPFWASKERPIISTIPMPALMEELDYPRRSMIQFSSRSGINVSATVENCDAYLSLYVPDPKFEAARISLTGNQLVAECYGINSMREQEALLIATESAYKLGLPASLKSVRATHQRYAKILPIDEGERRRFIMWASDVHGVYSLGRFATWRPGLLLDDVVQDVRVIQRLISNRAESYAHKLKG